MNEENSELNKLIEALGSSETEEPNFFQYLESKSEKAESLADRENRGIIEMRQIWSTWVLIFIGVIIIFDIILVTFYGLGIWSFDDTKVVMVVMTENFLKIIGLGTLITLSIFKKIFPS